MAQGTQQFHELLRDVAAQYEALWAETQRLRKQAAPAPAFPAALPPPPGGGPASPRAPLPRPYIGEVPALELEEAGVPGSVPLAAQTGCWIEGRSVSSCSGSGCSSGATSTPGSAPSPGDNCMLRSLTDNSCFVKGACFADAEAMKETVRKTVAGKQGSSGSNVTGVRRSWYKRKGCWQWIARSAGFEYTTYVVVALNAVWIAVDTDYNDADLLLDAEPVFQIMENLFCAFFFLEWLVRFLALKSKCHGLSDAWFIFDSFLMITMVLETWGMNLVAAMLGSSSPSAFGEVGAFRLLRLLRLTRLSRMARLVRLMPELLCMLRGMVQAVRSVAYTLGLLMSIIYVFSILLKQLSAGSTAGEMYFPSVAESVYTLLVHGTLLDGVGEVLNDLREGSPVVALVFALVVFLAALTMMNMLVGVLCEVMSSVAATEREQIAVAFVKDRVQTILKDLDKNNDGHITKREFESILHNQKATLALKEVGVDPVALVDFAELIFQSDECGKEFEKTLDFHDFMDLALQLRGTKTATVRDVVDLRKFLQADSSCLNLRLARLEERLKRLAGFLGSDSDGCPPRSGRRPSRQSCVGPVTPE